MSTETPARKYKSVVLATAEDGSGRMVAQLSRAEFGGGDCEGVVWDRHVSWEAWDTSCEAREGGRVYRHAYGPWPDLAIAAYLRICEHHGADPGINPDRMAAEEAQHVTA